jgi:hypothetical protein
LAISAVFAFSAAAQQELAIDQVMSSDELKSTGGSTMKQRRLDETDYAPRVQSQPRLRYLLT